MGGEWIEWGGGDCPVPPDTKVDLRYRDGEESLVADLKAPDESPFAHHAYWRHHQDDVDNRNLDIVAYRIVTP